jgi:hypothetical protein
VRRRALLAAPLLLGAHRMVRWGYQPERILLVGDSILAGITDVSVQTPGIVPELSRVLASRGVEHQTVNVAVPGWRAEHWVSPTYAVRPPAAPGRPRVDRLTAVLREHQPTTVLVELGTNERPDSAAAVEHLRTLYATIVARVHAVGARLVMARQIQISIEDGTGIQDRERLVNAEVLAPIVARYELAGPDFTLLGQTGLSTDRIHPSWPEGHTARGRMWADAGWPEQGVSWPGE